LLPALEKPIVCYVTDRQAFGPHPAAAQLGARIRSAVAAGVDWIQVREKDLSARDLFAATSEALTVGRAQRRPDKGALRVLVNDRLDVAIAARAHGLHLGQASVPVGEVFAWRRRGILPQDFALGVSCHDLEEARAAENAGADYIFFGPIFDTPSKRSFGPAQGIDRLSGVCKAVRVPVIAIGGVDQTNGGECIIAGAAGVAAIRMFQESNQDDQLRRAIDRIRSATR
jgi:thiamine-phosphate pyrophosphorylase